jgi:5-methylcytosine-specific restriction enzyme subunit McrC
MAVLDTKYKPVDRPAIEDLEQIVAYAQAKGCQEAVFVYPIALPVPFNERVGDIRVRSLAFALGGDLEESGREFLDSVLRIVHSGPGRVTRSMTTEPSA